ncbi:MAG: tyrosine-type recombinase/integrase, partial [Sphingomonas sp.]
MNMLEKVEAAPAHDAAAVRRMGEMLNSAIRRGALLDDRLWQPWIAGVQHAITICGTLVSVEIAFVDRVRRWSADPLTAALILRWHRDQLVLPPKASARDCLAAVGIAGAVVGRLIEQSAEAWSYRAPGAVLAYAKCNVPARPVPTSTWERVVYGPGEAEPKSSRQPSKRVDRPPGHLARRLWMETAALRKHSTDSAVPFHRGKAAHVARKSAALSEIEALPPPTNPVHSYLRAWALFALRREAGRVSIGYAPATVEDYLAALCDLLDGWRGDIITCRAGPFENFLLDMLGQMTPAAQLRGVKALCSFERFANRDRAEPLDLDLEEFGGAGQVAANLVLPDELARATDRFRKAGEHDLADMSTLMFRAGLRLGEVAALRVGDVAVADGRVELTVEENSERSLKTKTSCRIIPLDILLDDAELDQLLARVDARVRLGCEGFEAWLFGPPLAISPLQAADLAKRINAALQAAAASEWINHHHLRHSFASYLLATLMLPQDDDHPAVPPRLASVVSPARFRRVADRLLGHQRLGAGSLHAVSQLMGHTGPGTTIRSYCHLLDLSLALYCGRPATLVPTDVSRLLEIL